MSRWWGLFWVLGVIWGSSFLLIRIGVDELGQYQLVFIRTLIAAVGLNAVLLMQGKRIPLTWKAWRPLILVGIGNTLIPFVLITWGEKSVESGVAAVLNATTSLFNLVISHFALTDERMTPNKVMGLVIGFIGVVILASRSWENGGIDAGGAESGAFAGMLAIIVASLFYAIFTVFSKKILQGNLEPMMVSAGAMTSAAVGAGILTFVSPLMGGVAPVALTDLSLNVLLAVVTLGFVNTLIAYTIYYSLVRHLGSVRTGMVTYVLPPVGLILGVIFLNEMLDAQILLGAGLIIAGIVIVNLRLFGRQNPAVASSSVK